MNAKELFQIRPTNEEQNDFIITVGQHLATEKHFPTREEAEKYRDTPQWDTTLAMVSEMFIIMKKTNIKEQENEYHKINREKHTRRWKFHASRLKNL